MKILLIAMPDTVSALDAVMKIPNLGNMFNCRQPGRAHSQINRFPFHNHNIRRYHEGILNDFQPEIIGLSAMSYQYASAAGYARICRNILPQVKIVLGKTMPRLMYREIGDGAG